MLGGTSQDNFLNHHQSAPPTAGGGGAGAHLEGYLNKKRTKLTYRKRWFVQEEHVLQYYQSQEDARWFQDLEAGREPASRRDRPMPPKVIQVKGAVVQTDEHAQDGFSIANGPDDVLYLKANSAEELQQWVVSLLAQSRCKSPPPTPAAAAAAAAAESQPEPERSQRSSPTPALGGGGGCKSMRACCTHRRMQSDPDPKDLTKASLMA